MENVDYVNTFITVAPDAASARGDEPPLRADSPTVASRTWAMIHDHPYAFTSADVIFTVWADRNNIEADDREAARVEFFTTSRACLRSSDLGKCYGWGLHADADARLAAYAVDSDDYAAFASGTSPLDGATLTVTPAMRSSRR